jgi:cytochrome c5
MALLPLAGCEPAPAPAPAQATALDARQAAIYERACTHCHDVATSGAPQRGDGAAWSARTGAGLPALVASVRAGKGTMPPMGWCPECSDEDLAALIAHLQRSAAP